MDKIGDPGRRRIDLVEYAPRRVLEMKTDVSVSEAVDSNRGVFIKHDLFRTCGVHLGKLLAEPLSVLKF